MKMGKSIYIVITCITPLLRVGYRLYINAGDCGDVILKKGNFVFYG
jgi:predicted RNA-binding protein YlqC (UPF0109 family)